MSNELKIEAGKYYRMRNGERAYVALTNKPGAKPIVGWRDGGQPHEWTTDGSHFDSGIEALYDIISEWVEPERIPWEHLPKWCRWWAKDKDGAEWGFRYQPLPESFSWQSTAARSACPVLDEHRSNYTGDWRNSLRERPEGV